MKKLRVIELFAGIGAPRKALMRGGYNFKIVDAVEIDKYAVKSYNAIYNDNIETKDICSYKPTKEEIGEIDLLFHGSPCQDFSLAGKQAGGDKDSGTRSSLMYETIRIVEELKPKYVIWENVKNLLSKKHRHNFNAYLETMEELGYKSYYQVLNAKDYGIPQNRERVFTVSIRNDIGKDSFSFPKPQILKKKLKDMLEKNVDEKYYLTEEKIDISHWKSYQKPFEKVQGNNSIVPTLTARGAGEEHSGMITYSDKLEETTNLQNECLHIKNATKKGYLEPTVCELRYDEGIRTFKNNLCGSLRTIDACGNKCVITNQTKEHPCTDDATKKRMDSFIEELEKSNIINGIQEKYSYDGYNNKINKTNIIGTVVPQNSRWGITNGWKIIEPPLKIRKLTPKECFRLMGFDDEDFEKASKINSNTQLYKQAGNSIVVNVLEAIFDNLLKDYK